MMNNLFKLAEACLYETTIDEKLALTHLSRQLLENNELLITQGHAILPVNEVKFPNRPELLAPRLMPKRKLNAANGMAAFFHAIAHIEFVAIYLAWDIIYRFRGLPEQFYHDWLCIADEEAQHFELIRIHLRKMAIDYGDLPAHSGLWNSAVDTAGDILARLAVVPRCLEARGLDVTPDMITKFKKLGDQDSVQLLTRILTDEIGHVERGSFWFKTFCQQQHIASEAKFKELIELHFSTGKPKGPFNHQLRKQAGFSQDELMWLENS